MTTCPETFVPLVHCIINDTVSEAKPDLRQMPLEFTDVMNLMSLTNAYVPKEHISALSGQEVKVI